VRSCGEDRVCAPHASRQEAILGGCEILGDGLDPPYQCLDCTFIPPNPDRERMLESLPRIVSPGLDADLQTQLP